MAVVEQLVEELREALAKKEVLAHQLDSVDFSITVMKKEILARLPLAQTS